MNLSYLLTSNVDKVVAQFAAEAAALPVSIDASKAALAESVRRIYQGFVRGEAPRRTGLLGSTIQGVIGPGDLGSLVITFDSEATYTRYVIEGTGLYGPRHSLIYPTHAKALRFVIDGNVIFAKFTRGQKPNPFQLAAWERSQPAMKAAMQLAGNSILLTFR